MRYVLRDTGMRKQFVTTIEDILNTDERLVLLLGDIGVWGFRNAFEKFPDRVYNIGILEQSTVGLASGLAMTGLVPVVHTIAPFLVERSYEQLKLDFGYQELGGNFISVGGSYDYAALGCTHHCPADVSILKNIPGMEIIVPGTPAEFDALFKHAYADGKPTYFRLSERSNSESNQVEFGKANIIQKGKSATVIAVGPTLKPVLAAVKDMDVTVLYYTTIIPFDAETLKNNAESGKILLCEPYYSGALMPEIMNAVKPKPVTVETVGVPNEFLNNYGTAEEHDEYIGLTSDNIRNKLVSLISS
jgi:transketolase